MAQGTKKELWEIVVTKIGILSSDVPNNKHLASIADFILTLDWDHVEESVLLPTL